MVAAAIEAAGRLGLLPQDLTVFPKNFTRKIIKNIKNQGADESLRACPGNGLCLVASLSKELYFECRCSVLDPRDRA